ncbi:30S ribosomal protein S9 [Atribacter laminatus]|uniref:Small ribosomal subunit protein uS9 n=2 Tax=Atribacter laminatus TaxID=2847778 RepID=A0A7T1F473_ATRLM|nr:30S ribosomal protein S9 [Atribacter laminatus]
MSMDMKYYATGRRKTSIAKVWLTLGSGKVVINGRELKDYFPQPVLQILAIRPLTLTGSDSRFNVNVMVEGGGLSGQAGAMALGISRSLIKIDENLKPTLKKAGLLTRDPRMKERKKYGQRSARARFQFSKR